MSFRTGFIARGFMALGPLTVSFGYGPLTDDPIQAPVRVETLSKVLPPPSGEAADPIKPQITSGRRKKRG
jgi:hypothetical protein